MKNRQVYPIAVLFFVFCFIFGALSLAVVKADAVGVPSKSVRETVDETGPYSLVLFSQSVVDMVIEHLIEGRYASFFSGTKTSGFVKSIILSKIKDHITDEVLIQSGLEVTEADRSELAEEVYSIACIYYDEIHADGGSIEMANRLAVIEGIRYYLVIVRGYPEEEALKLAVMEYDRSTDANM